MLESASALWSKTSRTVTKNLKSCAKGPCQLCLSDASGCWAAKSPLMPIGGSSLIPRLKRVIRLASSKTSSYLNDTTMTTRPNPRCYAPTYVASFLKKDIIRMYPLLTPYVEGYFPYHWH
jgi:hypothetical protein